MCSRPQLLQFFLLGFSASEVTPGLPFLSFFISVLSHRLSCFSFLSGFSLSVSKDSASRFLFIRVLSDVFLFIRVGSTWCQNIFQIFRAFQLCCGFGIRICKFLGFLDPDPTLFVRIRILPTQPSILQAFLLLSEFSTSFLWKYSKSDTPGLPLSLWILSLRYYRSSLFYQGISLRYFGSSFFYLDTLPFL